MKKPRIKEKYNYVIAGDRISAGARFAGNWVWAHAARHPDDEYDEDFGKKLAAARCNQKIANLRYRRAEKNYQEKLRVLREVENEFAEACEYLSNSYILRKRAIMRVFDLLNLDEARDK